eukprot:1183576-Prymnesium_polylepis.1
MAPITALAPASGSTVRVTIAFPGRTRRRLRRVTYRCVRWLLLIALLLLSLIHISEPTRRS